MISFGPLSSDEALRLLAEPPEAFGRDLSTEGVSEEAAAAEEARQLDEILPDGLDTPGHKFCWVRSGDEEVGRIWFGPYVGSTSDYYLYRFLIDAKFRGRGVGHEALDVLANEIRKEGGKRVGLNVFESMPTAIHLYESAGFITHRAGPANREMWLELQPTLLPDC